MNEKLKPIITTIIPTYRRPKLLKKAINSVLKQTYPNFQVCVYDNASGDDTASVVAEIAKADHRVKYYCHAENIGGVNNFQYGLEHVETPFFSFLADDDLIFPEFYETALVGFESFPESMFSATDVIHMDMQGNILNSVLETWTPGFYRPPDGLRAVLKHGHSEWTGILFRKEVIDNVGLLDPTIWCMDLDFTLRIAARYPFVVSKRPGATFQIDAKQYVIPFDIRWSGWLKMIQHLAEDKNLSVYVRADAERILWAKFEKTLFKVGVGYLNRGYPVDAKKVAVVLRNRFGRFGQYLALSAIISTCKYVPFARLALSRFVVCYIYILDQFIKSKKKQYRNLRSYLD
ncbi:glycosyltransferase family 2 protein [Chloroflexota bacterium]